MLREGACTLREGALCREKRQLWNFSFSSIGPQAEIHFSFRENAIPWGRNTHRYRRIELEGHARGSLYNDIAQKLTVSSPRSCPIPHFDISTRTITNDRYHPRKECVRRGEAARSFTHIHAHSRAPRACEIPPKTAGRVTLKVLHSKHVGSAGIPAFRGDEVGIPAFKGDEGGIPAFKGNESTPNDIAKSRKRRSRPAKRKSQSPLRNT